MASVKAEVVEGEVAKGEVFLGVVLTAVTLVTPTVPGQRALPVRYTVTGELARETILLLTSNRFIFQPIMYVSTPFIKL
jgi:hypothetical protein